LKAKRGRATASAVDGEWTRHSAGEKRLLLAQDIQRSSATVNPDTGGALPIASKAAGL